MRKIITFALQRNYDHVDNNGYSIITLSRSLKCSSPVNSFNPYIFAMVDSIIYSIPKSFTFFLDFIRHNLYSKPSF